MRISVQEFTAALAFSIAMTVAGHATIQDGENTLPGVPISVELVDVSLVDFLRVISEVSSLNILIDPDVKSSLTINAEQIPWDQLLETVLESQDLASTRRGDLLRISRKETLQQQVKTKQALKREAFLLEELQTAVQTLNYAHGETLIKSLEPLLSERGRINLDERTNTLIIRDVQVGIDRISEVLEALDKPARQVEIEARIVEATTKFTKQLGVQLGLHLGLLSSRYRAGMSVIAPVDQPVATGSFAIGGILDTFVLDAAITAAEMKGEARMISKPRISTQNNTEARIVQGAKIPIPVERNYTTNVRYETAALHLSVRPQITGEGMVSLEIKVENSVPDFTQTVREIPTILTSESHTRVLVSDGATTVIGGIFVETNRKRETRAPGLSRIPVLGRLFGRTGEDQETREILFFITSRIQPDT